MNKAIDVKLTCDVATYATELALLVERCEDDKERELLQRALVLAERAYGLLGSFVSRTRLALGIKTCEK